jgi:Icc protein
VTQRTLQSVLEHIRAENWQADMVAMTGDLAQDDSAGAYRRFRDLLAALDLPVHCVPGNHDVRALMKDALSQAPFHYCDTYTRHNWTIIGIDSCLSGSAGGHIADDEMNRLRRALEDCDTDHVLVCLHHPPQPVGSRWLDEVGLDNGDEFLRTIGRSGNVRGCLFGHAHQQFEGEYDAMRIIGTPSTCSQFRPHSDHFALDERPPAYRRVLLRADGRIDSELIWLPLSQQDSHDIH